MLSANYVSSCGIRRWFYQLIKASTADDAECNTGNQEINKLYKIMLKEAIYDSVFGPVMQMVGPVATLL